MLDSLVVLRSSTWLVDTPSLPHGGAEAEDRHSNFYDTWVNLLGPVEAEKLPHPRVLILQLGHSM